MFVGSPQQSQWLVSSMSTVVTVAPGQAGQVWPGWMEWRPLPDAHALRREDRASGGAPGERLRLGWSSGLEPELPASQAGVLPSTPRSP